MTESNNYEFPIKNPVYRRERKRQQKNKQIATELEMQILQILELFQIEHEKDISMLKDIKKELQYDEMNYSIKIDLNIYKIS